VSGEIRSLSRWYDKVEHIGSLASQPPIALVPIAKLQASLLARAQALGAEVLYECDVVRLRRHAREVSLLCQGGDSVRATMAIVATGAARPLIANLLREPASVLPEHKLIAGVFAVGGDRGRWVRVEVPVAGHLEAVRCTLLQTPTHSGSGTAVLIDPRLGSTASDDQLRACFDGAVRELGLEGAPYLHEPAVFTSTVSEVPRRLIGGDNRAPVVIAGDAAQTGHVFSGQTCFINVALALGLCEGLRKAKRAITEHAIEAPQLARAFSTYASESATGAWLLAQASARHTTRHAPGAWALAGIAQRG
jgi:2-polyprenyl-6-methoxyphenol hydroxylase-like FAD-dependent oxidoreductase